VFFGTPRIVIRGQSPSVPISMGGSVRPCSISVRVLSARGRLRRRVHAEFALCESGEARIGGGRGANQLPIEVAAGDWARCR
jgi:hypothetical protein